jgi:hypothetical protein
MTESIAIDRRQPNRRADPVCRTCRKGLNMTAVRRSRYSIEFRCAVCGFIRSLAKPGKAVRSTDR